MSTMWTQPDYVHEPLYVIAPIFNPIRYKSRWKHYERFAAMVKAAGGVLVTVEAAFGDRHHALREGETQYETPIHQAAPTKPTEFHRARSTNPHLYIRVRTQHELWLKENLINIGISRLPEDWKYVAWVDADVQFTRPNWVGETVHLLQHYKLVQMFSHAQDVGPNYTPLQDHLGFVDCHLRGVPRKRNGSGGYTYGGGSSGPIEYHPGFAWAARRDAIDALGGLMDFPILGAADNHMAHALIGQARQSVAPGMGKAYLQRVLEWEFRAERHIRQDVGVMSGLILHNWHGPKKNRLYWDRWKILVKNGFDPNTDVKYDGQGVLQLVDRGTARSIALRDELRAYFRQRNEDDIRVDA